MEESSYNGSFYEQPTDAFGHGNTLSQLTPSEYGSAFSRPTSALSNSGHSNRFAGLSQSGAAGGYASGLSSPIKDGRSETDEELSQYGWEDSASSNQWNRRPSLPLHHRPGSRKWDFKARRRSSFKAPKPIGRISPLTPSNPPAFSSSPPFLELTTSKRSPPSPVKDQLILEVNEPQTSDQFTQESTDNEATNTQLVESQQPDDNPNSDGGDHHEEHEESESQSATDIPSSPLSPSPQSTIVKDWPQNDDTLPAYEEEDTHNQSVIQSGSPTSYTTVKVLKSTPEHSPTGSLSRRTTTKTSTSEVTTHPVELVSRASPPHLSPSRTEFPRRTSAPETSVAMRPKHTSSAEPKSHSTSSFEPMEPMQNYKRTIHKANEFEKAMRALAESGSSDPDSDSEPHGEKHEDVTVLEHKKIQEKMRVTNSNNQFKVHQISLKRKLGTSFGFSLADGCFDPGIFVKTVKEGSPADKSGLLPFDNVVKVLISIFVG